MKKFIPIANIELGDEEIQAALDVLKTGNLRQGKRTEEFETEFARQTGAKYALATSSGTAALHLAYLSVLEPGDDVLVPSFTFIATASMVVFSNCKPIFCDVDPRTFTIDVENAKKRLTKKTKAIAPVHLFGNSCYIDEIIHFASQNGLKIIWDAAQAHSTKYKGRDVGSFDDLVCYSFYPTKNMITGEGGMITTNSENIYEKLRLLRSHGQSKKYLHTSLGLNYRMTDVEAAIGLEQLKKLDRFVNKRRESAQILTEGLSKINGIVTPFVEDFVRHSYHQYTILLDTSKIRFSRDEFISALKEEGIGTGVHYPRPLHKQPLFDDIAGDLSLPISEDISKTILSLPVYPSLDEKDMNSIIQAISRTVAILENKP
jgi:perosamine synthetase